MSQLLCEICGSDKFLKESGCFVCQNCGAKYSIEETRKMMIDGIVDVKVSRGDDISRIKKLADTAYENETWLDAVKYYTQLLEIYDGDYESNFRCLVSKCHVNCSEFPSTQKSIEIVLHTFGDYREQLMRDKSIQLENKKKIIIDFFDKIASCIYWIYDRDNPSKTDSDGNRNTICFRCHYESMIDNLEISIELFYKLFEIMENELNLCPFIEKQFKRNLKIGNILLSKYDFEYEKPRSQGRYFGDDFDRFLDPLQKLKAGNFRRAIESYSKALNDRYWDKHRDERTKLEDEKNNLNLRIKVLKKMKRKKYQKLNEK